MQVFQMYGYMQGEKNDPLQQAGRPMS